MDNAGKAKRILDILEKEFPSPGIALEFKTPLELLIATILSAQCTDERVNKTTRVLFKKYKKPSDYAASALKTLEADMGQINFFRSKAANIRACCARIDREFDGKVPSTLEGLTTLPGVGRKTANVVLGNAFGEDALAVDTHVKRVSQRIGLARSDDPLEIEEALCSVIPRDRWTLATRLFILHGRKTCRARNPLCGACSVNGLCEYYRAKTATKPSR